MTEYKLPAMPDAFETRSLWDKEGREWVRVIGNAGTDGWADKEKGDVHVWWWVLVYRGPLTDQPPAPPVSEDVRSLWDGEGEQWLNLPDTYGWTNAVSGDLRTWTWLTVYRSPLTDQPPTPTVPKDALYVADKDGDVWRKARGKWWYGNVFSKEGYKTLPDNFGPYRALKYWED